MRQGKTDRPTVDEPSGNKEIEPKCVGAGFMLCGKLMDTICGSLSYVMLYTLTFRGLSVK